MEAHRLAESDGWTPVAAWTKPSQAGHQLCVWAAEPGLSGFHSPGEVLPIIFLRTKVGCAYLVSPLSPHPHPTHTLKKQACLTSHLACSPVDLSSSYPQTSQGPP